MTNQLLAAALCAALSIPAARAQSNFRPGYVVSAAGDTTRGEVDYQTSARGNRSCRFRPGAAGAVTDYTPEQLRAYGFPGDKAFRAYAVPTTRPAAALVQPYFLEVLVSGPLSLYYLNEASAGDLYYLQEGSAALQPLRSWQETVYDEQGRKFVQERAEYRTTLAAAMRACPSAQPGIATTSFQRSRLAALVRSYNTCVGGPQLAAPTSPASRSHLNLTAVAGAQASTLGFAGAFVLDETSYRGKPSPAFGLALEIHTAMLVNRLSIVLEALYSSQRYEGDYHSSFNQRYSLAQYGQARVQLSQLRVPLLLRYAVPAGAFRPFVEAGIGTAYATGSVSQEYRISRSAPPNAWYDRWEPIFSDSRGESSARGLETGLVLGLGVRTARPNARNLGLELRGERSNGFSEATGVSTTVNRLFLLLRYDLTR